MTAVEDDLVKMNERCKKIVDGQKSMDEAHGLIEDLEQVQVTIDVLTKTRIGMTINELRKKTTDERLAKKAKALIRKWKILIDAAAANPDKSVVNHPKQAKHNGKLDSTHKPSKRKSQSPDEENPPAKRTAMNTDSPPATSSAPFEYKRPMVTDDARKKTITVLTNSLKISELPEHTQNPEDVAQRIEEVLYNEHGGTNANYYAAVRSRAFNLRDRKNPHLRENVLTGAVSAKKFAMMTIEEMASDEMKKQREDFTKEGILEHQMSVQEGTPTDMFKCGRCGQHNCTYTQVQTRSADEPMTTFVFCRSCGNRWKFC